MSPPVLHHLALGGGCHWCTEAVFQVLKGVRRVDQGWINTPTEEGASEGVVVHFDPHVITLRDLVRVHLHTHASSADHSFRHRYRSALYAPSEDEAREYAAILAELAAAMPEPAVTRVLPFGSFRFSREEIRDYYRTDPQRPFCTTYIEPKLALLRERFAHLLDAG